MTDHLDQDARSRLMSRIRSKDTRPEMVVRRTAHRLGLRFRLHAKALPGSPDLVLARRRTVIFVHGCFWHRHEGCPRATWPIANADRWREKFASNVARDRAAIQKLESAGWRVMLIWECETRRADVIEQRLRDAFDLAEMREKSARQARNFPQ